MCCHQTSTGSKSVRVCCLCCVHINMRCGGWTPRLSLLALIEEPEKFPHFVLSKLCASTTVLLPHFNFVLVCVSLSVWELCESKSVVSTTVSSARKVVGIPYFLRALSTIDHSGTLGNGVRVF